VLALGGACYSLRWTGPDQLLIAASPGDVRTWSPARGTDQAAIDAHARVTAAYPLSDGLALVTSWDGTASIWDLARTRMVDRLAHGGPVGGADTAAAGSVFATVVGTQIVVWHRPIAVSATTVRSIVEAGPYRVAESGQLVKRDH
jgi:WD40 repeat protein